jgi:Tfp pilus assembly protein PilX
MFYRQVLELFRMPAAVRNQDGVATLPTIMALSILILVIGIGITALTFSETFIQSSQKQSALALRYAEAGAKDALLRITKNKNYNCPTADCYAIDMVSGGCSGGTGCAKVSVSAGVGSSGDPKIITAKGEFGTSTRRVQVEVQYDSNLFGKINSTVWTELTN